MDDAFRVHDPGAVYVDKNQIKGVLPLGSSTPPAGFEDAPVFDTGGTILPGLIELHNHLSYNALRLWNVPKKYGDRDEWGRAAEYAKLVTGPMHVIGQSAAMPSVSSSTMRSLCSGSITSTR